VCLSCLTASFSDKTLFFFDLVLRILWSPGPFGFCFPCRFFSIFSFLCVFFSSPFFCFRKRLSVQEVDSYLVIRGRLYRSADCAPHHSRLPSLVDRCDQKAYPLSCADLRAVSTPFPICLFVPGFFHPPRTIEQFRHFRVVVPGLKPAVSVSRAFFSTPFFFCQRLQQGRLCVHSFPHVF